MSWCRLPVARLVLAAHRPTNRPINRPTTKATDDTCAMAQSPVTSDASIVAGASGDIAPAATSQLPLLPEGEPTTIRTSAHDSVGMGADAHARFLHAPNVFLSHQHRVWPPSPLRRICTRAPPWWRPAAPPTTARRRRPARMRTMWKSSRRTRTQRSNQPPEGTIESIRERRRRRWRRERKRSAIRPLHRCTTTRQCR